MSLYFIPPEEFFQLLYEDAEFCRNVGQVMLAAGMLETNLRKYLHAKNVKGLRRSTTLGGMVRLLKDNDLLSKNGVRHFECLAQKRNYLAHSLHDLFAEVIVEAILPRENLTDGDVHFFTEKAWLLAEDFKAFSKIVSTAKQENLTLL